MSKVTQVTVRYGRSVQPKPYESKEASLEAVVIADEGGTISQEQVGVVMRSLIYDVHAALGAKPADGPVDNSTDEPPKKTRKTRAKKGEKKPDPEASQEEAKAAAVADEVPVDGDEVATSAAVEGVSDQELQSAAAGAAAKHGAAKVKDLMKEFGTILLGKLDQPKRLEFLSKLDELDA